MINRWVDKYHYMINQNYELLELYINDTDGYSYLLGNDYYLNKTKSGPRITSKAIEQMIAEFSLDDSD